MQKKVDILGVFIDSVTINEAVNMVKRFLKEDKPHAIYTPNAEIMMAAHRDPYLKKILQEGDMVIADGAGVVLASRILGLNLPEKVAGFDLVKNILLSEKDRNLRLFLLGGFPGIAETAGKNMEKHYEGVEIAGFHHGYFSSEDEPMIIELINKSEADILLVALGAPKQEKWIYEHKNRLNVKVLIGVGGSLDIFAGKTRLAPEFFRRNGLEWLYRLYMEPWRFKRMLDLPRFMALVLFKRLTGGK